MNGNSLNWASSKVFGGSGEAQGKKAPGAYQAPTYADNAQQMSAGTQYGMPKQASNPGMEYGKAAENVSGQTPAQPYRGDFGGRLAQETSDSGVQWALTRDEAYDQNPFFEEGPPTIMSPGYTPYYLRSIIGKVVRAEFNIGTNLYIDKSGILREVGINYFVLEDILSHALTMCDLYSLKFITSQPG